MGPEAAAAAHGARVADLHLLHPGPVQDPAVDSLQVHVEFFSPWLDPLLDFPAEGGAQGLGHVRVGLKMALADVRPNGGADILGPGAELAAHFLHHPRADGADGAPPPGMGRAHRVGPAVPEEDGGAVGGEHHQGQSGGTGDEGVAVLQRGSEQPRPPVPGGGGMDNVRMDLPGQHQVMHVKADGGPQAAVIFHHVLRVVPPAGADVQRFQIPPAHPTQPGGKAMRRGNMLRRQIFQLPGTVCFDHRFFLHVRNAGAPPWLPNGGAGSP